MHVAQVSSVVPTPGPLGVLGGGNAPFSRFPGRCPPVVLSPLFGKALRWLADLPASVAFPGPCTLLFALLSSAPVRSRCCLIDAESFRYRRNGS